MRSTSRRDFLRYCGTTTALASAAAWLPRPARVAPAARTTTWWPDIEKKVIADCGHWTQQEKPAELNAILVDWLKRKFT